MTQKQQQFIEMRAMGLSFNEIAKQLKIAKSTAIAWSKLFSRELDELRFVRMVALKESYARSVRSEYETLLNHLKRIDDAIATVDLSTANIKDLAQVRNSIIEQLERIEAKVTTATELRQQNVFGEAEPVEVSLKEIDD
ncbi:MAG: hypothetical protein K6347_04265 [Campylobacterales bacterium]